MTLFAPGLFPLNFLVLLRISGIKASIPIRILIEESGLNIESFVSFL